MFLYRSNAVLQRNANAVAVGGVTEEWWQMQQEAMLTPFGSQFDTIFLNRLYEVLMASIDKTGSFENFQNNINVLNQVVQNHYVSDFCIRDFSAQYKEQRAKIFLPIFTSSFNKRGLWEMIY